MGFPPPLCEWLLKSMMVPGLDSSLARGGGERGLRHERAGCSNHGKGWKFWEAAFTSPSCAPLFLHRPPVHTPERQRRWGLPFTRTPVVPGSLMVPTAFRALLSRASRFLLDL